MPFRRKLTNILFLDIECASAKPSFDDLDETFQQLWKLKSKYIFRDIPFEDITDDQFKESYQQKAAIYAEFGKIICISVGLLTHENPKDPTSRPILRLKSFADHDEKKLLQDFGLMLDKYFATPEHNGLCGHNIKEFDIPYICRRMVVHQLPFPKLLQLHGKKPWETDYLIDTMELWKFGDYKSYTSLKLLAAVLGFPSPKDDIDGSEVGRVYWQEKDLDRIARYCEKDVLATVQLLLRYRCEPLLEEDQVVYVDRQEKVEQKEEEENAS